MKRVLLKFLNEGRLAGEREEERRALPAGLCLAALLFARAVEKLVRGGS